MQRAVDEGRREQLEQQARKQAEERSADSQWSQRFLDDARRAVEEEQR